MRSHDENAVVPTKGADVTAMLVRSGLGIAPFVGPLLAEIANVMIPNQRVDRLDKYVRALSDKLGAISDRNEMATPLGIDLFEEGAFQSVRAVTEKRRDYIVSAVAKGLSGDQAAIVDARAILGILKDLDERQIIILASHLPKHGYGSPFYSEHESVLSQSYVLGAEAAVRDRREHYEYAMARLVSLKLLNETLRVGEYNLPKIDHSGNFEVSYRTLTRLGAMVLQKIGFDVDLESYL